MANKRIASIEFMRFICMLIIVSWHTKQPLFTHGYLPVDFFFILSGVFIYKAAYQKMPPPSPFDFTYKKIKKFFPKYLVASLFAFCVIVLFRNWHYNYELVSIKELFRFFTELFMFQEVGLFPRGINGPVWYLSVLIIGGGLLYSFAYRLKRFLSCFAPCFVLFGYTYLINETKGNFDEFYTVGFIRLPFLRGMCGMALGMLVGALAIKDEIFCHKVLREFLFFLCLVGMAYCLISEIHWDIYFCLFSAIVIYMCMLPKALINKVIHHHFFNKLGAITFDMLLLHFPINILWYHTVGILMMPWLSVLLLLAFNVLVAYLFNVIFRKSPLKSWI